MEKLFALPLILGLLFVLALVFAIPTMLLWDWLCPSLFKLREITLVEAWGVNLLTGLLFKSSSIK